MSDSEEDVQKRRTKLMNSLRECEQQIEKVKASSKLNPLNVLKLYLLRKEETKLTWMLNSEDAFYSQLYGPEDENNHTK